MLNWPVVYDDDDDFFFFGTLSHCYMTHWDNNNDINKDIRNKKLKCML